MKKHISTITVILLLLLGTRVSAQITDKIYSEPKDLKEMKSRTLVVALYGAKNKSKATVLYDSLIQKVVKEHWTINKTVEFKPISEVQKLIEKKDTKYVLLMYTVLRDMGLFNETIIGGGDEAPVLQYQRCEKKPSMRDQFAYLPYVAPRKENWLNEGDLIFTVRCLQQCVDYSIEKDKSTKMEDYLLAMAEKNCATKMKSKAIICDSAYKFRKVTSEDVKESYSGKFSFVKTKEITDAMTSKAADKYVTFFCVWGIAKSAGMAMLLCVKIVFDPSTYEIIYYFEPGGGISDNTIRTMDLKRMDKCKHN